jgi:hypothetical protein
MLSSPDAKESRGECRGAGGSQSLAKSTTIWYPRA